MQSKYFVEQVLEADPDHDRLLQFSAGDSYTLMADGQVRFVVGKGGFAPVLLAHMPLYVRRGVTVPFAEPVQHTGELGDARRFEIAFDATYHGLETSELGRYITL